MQVVGQWGEANVYPDGLQWPCSYRLIIRRLRRRKDVPPMNSAGNTHQSDTSPSITLERSVSIVWPFPRNKRAAFHKKTIISIMKNL